jgi:hypothetical protein
MITNLINLETYTEHDSSNKITVTPSSVFTPSTITNYENAFLVKEIPYRTKFEYWFDYYYTNKTSGSGAYLCGFTLNNTHNINDEATVNHQPIVSFSQEPVYWAGYIGIYYYKYSLGFFSALQHECSSDITHYYSLSFDRTASTYGKFYVKEYTSFDRTTLIWEESLELPIEFNFSYHYAYANMHDFLGGHYITTNVSNYKDVFRDVSSDENVFNFPRKRKYSRINNIRENI